MKKLTNIKKAPLEIATLLAKDTVIKQLLFLDTPDALTGNVSDITLNQMLKEHYVSFEPPVENRIEEYQRNTFISILIDSISLYSSEDNISANIVIYVSTNADHILLTDNKNRLLELIDRISQIVDGKKISASGSLYISNAQHVMLSEFHSGYRISCRLSDLQHKEGDI